VFTFSPSYLAQGRTDHQLAHFVGRRRRSIRASFLTGWASMAPLPGSDDGGEQNVDSSTEMGRRAVTRKERASTKARHKR
jgi:hypothetical protein